METSQPTNQSAADYALVRCGGAFGHEHDIAAAAGWTERTRLACFTPTLFDSFRPVPHLNMSSTGADADDSLEMKTIQHLQRLHTGLADALGFRQCCLEALPRCSGARSSGSGWSNCELCTGCDRGCRPGEGSRARTTEAPIHLLVSNESPVALDSCSPNNAGCW